MKLLRCLVALGVAVLPVIAQSLTLRGRVTDETGALLPGARIALTGPGGVAKSTRAANDGTFSFSDLPAGEYAVAASAPGLAMAEPLKVSIQSGSQMLTLVLRVAAEKQAVNVQENSGPAVSTESAANASAVVMSGTDLDALSEDPDDLLADLQALAGPGAGPSGGSLFIDGFSGGELPPKNSIREIRINQNPFSPEYDKLGLGRIEIFTRPGTDKFHADLGYNYANDWWDSRNPYAADKAPFHLHELRELVSGALGKRASFSLNLIREWVDNGNAVNAVVVDPRTFAVTPFTDTPLAQLRRTGAIPRVDYQLSASHTLTVMYSYHRDIVRDAGTGSLNLVSRGYHNNAVSQTVQIAETAVIGTSVINEARFQYFRPETTAQANTPGYAVEVLGAFSGYGNPIGRSLDTQNNYELQNYTSAARAKHTLRFGVRFRGETETSVSPSNFAGTFTFGGGLAPQLDGNNQPVLDAAGQPVMVNISSIESYRRTLLFQQAGYAADRIRQLGGGATQFSINSGDPLVSGRQFDAGIFAGDDWRAKPNLTVSLGLRYEVQSNLHERGDFAPRMGVAWAPRGGAGKEPKTVIRAGFGMFYDRFSLSNTLTALRFNGVRQSQYVIANPDFFPHVPAPSTLGGPVPNSTIQQISSTMRAPYLMQSAVSFERQMPLRTTVALTFANSHGVHLLRSDNINAPLPGTYAPSVPGSGVYPFGRPGLVALMESAGLYNQSQMIVNVNSRIYANVSMTGSYAYNRAMSNTDGLNTFPGTPYSMAGEYGPAATDMRHRVTLGGTITTKWGIRFNPLLTANSGPPFDITAGRDIYGDTLFNARPGMATDPAKPGVVSSFYGLLDPAPSPGDAIVPRNFGRGPGQVMLNLRVGRTFTFGARREGATANTGGSAGADGSMRSGPANPFGEGAAGGSGVRTGRRYNLTISMQVRNLMNHNNPGPIFGNVTSPLFGQANQPAGSGNGIFSESANNRRLELQTRFTF
jgi:Carboxypeptidase regulatory-like domain